MGDISKLTLAEQRAHKNIKKGFDRAAGRIADIPLGKEKVDPRTHKKRVEAGLEKGMDTDLSRILYEMRSEQQTNPGEEQQ